MSVYTAEVLWQRDGQDFTGNRYSRRHVLRFDGGAEVPGSSSPHVVPLPMSDASAVDPEEMFIASLSSCHMLWFLSLAAKQRFVVDRYVDAATGLMEKNREGRMAMTVVTLRPQVTFSGEREPTRDELERLHHAAHDACFIASSVRTEVRCEPVVAGA
ncbi:OsmC family protein [Cupriavidus oxalaticus]|uniref:Peroxiredoxin n=1 Tax=Cupriavidus oxalaticus TaxID=96344 RepID=A0A375FVA7_9BURK|nr:OsmC family protein [Cupriavidus oxalaticus]QEZ48224.1 OsmC family peroxiredoxin [Cupriavidus oxalaticus]QRQ87493.1 OsmC family protein [Cupriavidus oxalaticus]QRQ94179.1 OsmC family protein [Cupriavidus oxalaticus]WQD82816.1 OsmC family protein [Cupriavidus oxalaticus]SPC10725.1 Peroxiredoxin [Cupriavidus oxalaticus]